MYNQTLPGADAGTDLRAFRHRAINIAGTLATGTPQSRGMLDVQADSGEPTTMIVSGRSKYQSAGAIGAFEPMNVASGGLMVAATSGGVAIGFNEGSAVTSGSFGHGVFDFRARTLTTSEG